MAEKITIEQAAKAMHCTPLSLRVAIQNGLIPWARAVKREGSSHYTYLIFPEDCKRSVGDIDN